LRGSCLKADFDVVGNTNSFENLMKLMILFLEGKLLSKDIYKE
jgi:hypothetical protein